MSVAEAVRLIATVPPRLGSTRLVLIDGPSGSGKTTFALALHAVVGGELVHTDDLLDGWDDQFTYVSRLDGQILEPVSRGQAGRYTLYDWEAGRFAGELVQVEPGPLLIVEGVGAAQARRWASLCIFVDAPLELRLERSLRRDGAGMQAQLALWRKREDLHFAADATARRSDLVIRSGHDNPQR